MVELGADWFRPSAIGLVCHPPLGNIRAPHTHVLAGFSFCMPCLVHLSTLPGLCLVAPSSTLRVCTCPCAGVGTFCLAWHACQFEVGSLVPSRVSSVRSFAGVTLSLASGVVVL